MIRLPIPIKKNTSRSFWEVNRLNFGCCNLRCRQGSIFSLFFALNCIFFAAIRHWSRRPLEGQKNRIPWWQNSSFQAYCQFYFGCQFSHFSGYVTLAAGKLSQCPKPKDFHSCLWSHSGRGHFVEMKDCQLFLHVNVEVGLCRRLKASILLGPNQPLTHA